MAPKDKINTSPEPPTKETGLTTSKGESKVNAGTVNKKPIGIVFKTPYNGVFKIPVWLTDKKGEPIKKYVEFKDHTYVAFDPEILAALKKRQDEQVDLPPIKRDVMSEDDFFALTSPERLYIDYNGKKVHISDVRAGLAIAEDNGWKAEYREVIVTGESRSKVGRGDIGAGSSKL